MAAPSAPASLAPRLTSKATVKFCRTSMRPVDIAVPAWLAPRRRQGEDVVRHARAPVRRQRNGAGAGGVTVTLTGADLGVVPSETV